MKPSFILFLLATSASALDFNRDIQPVLAEHCFHCHGQDEQSRKGRLRLDLREDALKGGKSDGPAIIPGQPDKGSLLARILTHDEDEVMPPPDENKPVKPEDIAKIRQWIQDGAVFSGHWAFAKPVKAAAALPTGQSPVDFFIRQRLAKEGLQPSPAAKPETLCRRLHLDLIGLPPSPAEVDAFLAEVKSKGLQTAVEATADRLMKDRRFGEKWARHWLDVARYADSNGFEKDLPREQWVWRDWVIQALNQDMPYDRFITEQLAGDLLPKATRQQVIATGFLRNGMINEEGAIIPEEWRMEAMFDRMDTLGSGVLGLSLKCVQCHSHKFDPITQTEYYGLFAFLNNTYEAKSWVYSPEDEAALAKLNAELTRIDSRLKKDHPGWEKQVAGWEAAELKQWQAVSWNIVHPEDTHSSTGLNHPEVLPDDSMLTLGHPTSRGDLHFFAEPTMEKVTGVRIEVLKHGDLPMGGPGRSYKGSWALSELIIEARKPGSETWERLKLRNASADFEEPVAGLEPEWHSKAFNPEKRLRGPVAFMADGDPLTAWRADRGPGRRNTESVAVAQFEQPVSLPKGTKLKVALLLEHGGDTSDYRVTQIGRFRIAFTQTADPKAARTPYAALLAMQVPAAKRSAEQKQAIFDAWRAATPAMKTYFDEVAQQWAAHPVPLAAIMHLAERSAEDARVTRRLDRGVWSQGKEEVKPMGIATLHPLPKDPSPSRLTLARWLTDKNSPLTARVAVNRLWQAVFGTGIVETAEDFGTRAPEPSHADLLNWLAVDFMEQGWSQKRLLRTLVTSQTYQQSSQASPALLEKDPRNRLLARGPRFRAEAEIVRDIVLSISGLLSDKFGGPSIFPPIPQSVLDYNFSKPEYWTPAEDSTRYSRALYVFRKRSMPDPAMIAFDAPTGDTSCTRRPRSNSPLAALTSMNEPVFVEASQALALRVLREGGPDDESRINHAFRLCTSRLPDKRESEQIQKLLSSRRDQLKKGVLKASDIAFNALTRTSSLPADATPNDIAAWSIVSRMLLNLDETITKN